MICLFSGKKDLKSLRNDLGKPSTSILHGIKELDKLNLIKKEKKSYGLSSNGTMLAMNIIKLIQNIYSINNNSHFWDSHCIKDIPYESLKKIHLIQNAKSIRSSENDLAKTSKEYISLVSKSKDIKVLLPIFSSIHLDALLKSLNDGSNLELIASKNILEFIRDNGYGEKFSSFVKDNNMNNNKNNKNNSLKIWELSKEFKLFLSSCNNFLSLGLFSDDGYYDDSIMLLDNTKEGINWGLEVFEYYKEYSKQINILKYFNIKNNI
ncbi:winged helix-turn-helix domain-containing protein [Methanobrevibacter arboriphilus]|uniref:helix-turn-helix transcriptional regulator n=1 Tax=Methanobrevibacter arboriphilus TaxID=39441 RepID=UPI000693C325|nr:transcriptional regulator FilR1 domain-containing protein [Methanobrevibacter arboriphilus]